MEERGGGGGRGGGARPGGAAKGPRRRAAKGRGRRGQGAAVGSAGGARRTRLAGHGWRAGHFPRGASAGAVRRRGGRGRPGRAGGGPPGMRPPCCPAPHRAKRPTRHQCSAGALLTGDMNQPGLVRRSQFLPQGSGRGVPEIPEGAAEARAPRLLRRRKGRRTAGGVAGRARPPGSARPGVHGRRRRRHGSGCGAGPRPDVGAARVERAAGRQCRGREQPPR